MKNILLTNIVVSLNVFASPVLLDQAPSSSEKVVQESVKSSVSVESSVKNASSSKETSPKNPLPQDLKKFMETSVRSQTEFSFSKNDTETLVLKTHSAMILLRQSGDVFKIKVSGRNLVPTAIKAFKSRNGKALIIDNTLPTSAKKERIDYVITLPKNVDLRLSGGRLDVKLEGVSNAYVTVDAGQLIFKSQDSILTGFKGNVAEANIAIDGLTKQFLLVCANGNVQVRYLKSSLPKDQVKDALTFVKAPMVSVRQAFGRSLFSFPKDMHVMYKSSGNIKASFPSEKNADIRCIFYISDLVDLTLTKQED